MTLNKTCKNFRTNLKKDIVKFSKHRKKNTRFLDDEFNTTGCFLIQTSFFTHQAYKATNFLWT